MPDSNNTELHDRLDSLRVEVDRIGLANATDVRRRGDQRTRRTAVATGMAALVVVAGVVGLSSGFGGEKNRAHELPAKQPALGAGSLLVGDELPTYIPNYINEQWAASEPVKGEGAPFAAPCQRGDLSALGAQSSWRASFDVPREPLPGLDLQAGQVAAQFASAEQARRALTTIDGWFDRCPIVGFKRWPDVRVGEGLAHVIEYHDDTSADRRWHVLGYGRQGNAVTIVSFAYLPQEVGGGAGMGILIDPEPMHTTLRFALQRLAGTRTTSENGLREFRFAEERSGAWKTAPPPDADPVVRRHPNLGMPWQSLPCRNEGGGPKIYPSDALRVGMISVDYHDTDLEQRQFATYPDAVTAASVAADLLAVYQRCAVTADEFGPLTWTTKREPGPANLTIATATHTKSAAVREALAIGHSGNAVFLARISDDGPLGAPSTVGAQLQNAVEANLPLICGAARCD